jgi:trk system potassium uptake protein TrkH
MMIGGASGSTAGGVKMGTFALVLLTLYAVIRSKPDVVIFGRRVGHSTILHAMSLFVMWLILVVIGSALVSYWDNAPLLNSAYEVSSAYSTVGLTVGISETASVLTKILLIVYMFFGRVGIMTISVLFMTRSGKSNDIKYPNGTFIVG